MVENIMHVMLVQNKAVKLILCGLQKAEHIIIQNASAVKYIGIYEKLLCLKQADIAHAVGVHQVSKDFIIVR